MGSGWLLRPARPTRWGVVLLAFAALASEAGRGAPQTSSEASGRKGAAEPQQEIRRAIASGSYAEAEALARAALAEAEASSAPDSLQVAGVLDLLVEALIRGGKAADESTVDLAQRAVRIKEAALGPADRSLATSLSNMRAILSSAGDFTAVRPLFERALSIRERSLGSQHPDVARSLSNLAVLHRNTGNYPAAKALLERAIAILEKELGSESVQVAGLLSNLGAVLSNMGDLRGAKAVMERSLSIRQKVLGPDHLDVARSMDNL